MSNYLYSSHAVDSLIAYINDVKPYHSKLSEVVEEYQFYDNLNVSIDDATHLVRTKVAGIWDNEAYSNGLYSPFLNLPFIKQTKSSKYWNNNFILDPSKVDPQIPGLLSGYNLRHNIGLRQVLKDGFPQAEGVDFHVSHGAFTAKINGQDQKFTESVLTNVVGDDASQWVKGAQIISESTTLRYDDVVGTNGVVSNITPNLDASYEEWSLECVQTSNTVSGTKLSFEHNQTVPTQNWNIQHNLDSTELFIQCYISDESGLVPIFPNNIEFADNNTLNVNFTSPRTGKVKIIRYVASSQTFTAEFVTPSARWEINHNLNTEDIIFSTQVWIAGVLTQINPNNIEIIDENNAAINFTKAFAGKVHLGSTRSFTASVFEQPTPATVWAFNNVLRTDSGIFSVVRDDGSIIFPLSIKISESLVFVEFSTPVAGKVLFAKLFTAGNENTIFSVTGSETGLIGYARVGFTFSSDNIEFIISPKSENSVFYLGEKFVLTPANKITTHKSYSQEENWSLIKVNPIAYSKKPKFIKSGSPTISPFTILTDSIRPQIVKATYENGAFVISNDLDGIIGSTAMGVQFSTSEFAFTILPNSIAPVSGDFFEIEIENIAPSIHNLDLTVGYDIVSYNNTEYDDHFINFDLTSLGLQIVNPGIASSYFELSFTGTSFDVCQYDNNISRNVIRKFNNITIGTPYNNGQISLTIPGSVSYLPGDMFIFNVENPKPSFSLDDLHLISSRFGFINLYPKSFINSPAQRWEVLINADKSFTVTGSVDGQQIDGDVNKSYDNGFIHFTLLESSEIPFDSGDKFLIAIKDEKPSYLVHSETGGFEKPLTVGKWYWNGKIGLKINPPQYKINEFVSSGQHNQFARTFLTGKVIIDENARTIEFNKAPRYDAKSDVYLLELLDETLNGDQVFKVSTGNNGIQRGARVNQRYVDDMRPEQSRLLGFAHHDGVCDLTISDNSIPFQPDAVIKFEIISDAPKLFHANDLIIFNSPLDLTSITKVERQTTDKIYFKTSSKRAILGVDSTDPNDQWFPTYTLPSLPYSDENNEIDVFVSTTDTKLGSIRNIGVDGEQYQFVVDTNFFSEFLPFNSKISSKVVQNEQENAIVKARISERMKIFDLFRLSEVLSINIVDTPIFTIDAHSPSFSEQINVTIYDNNFRGFYSGYDTNPFEAETYGYDDTDTIQVASFGAVAGGKEVDVIDPVDPTKTIPGPGYGGMGVLVQDKTPSTKSTSKITETLLIFSKLADFVTGWAEPFAEDSLPQFDSFGWENATVIDGVPPVDSEGWLAASFDVAYGLQPEIPLQSIYELTATISKLSIPTPGSSLYGTAYTNVPSTVFSVNRRISTLTIIKRGLNASTAIVYEDASLTTQLPIDVIENTPDYIKINLITPAPCNIVVF